MKKTITLLLFLAACIRPAEEICDPEKQKQAIEAMWKNNQITASERWELLEDEGKLCEIKRR